MKGRLRFCCCDYLDYAFFFSSRRRHTRLTCDWSSDVCSSDLRHLQGGAGDVPASPHLHLERLEVGAQIIHPGFRGLGRRSDRKSTRLNSSHMSISYAVFCLKKKRKKCK